MSCLSEAEQFKHIHFHVIPKTSEYPEELSGAKAFALLKVDERAALSKDKVVEICQLIRENL